MAGEALVMSGVGIQEQPREEGKGERSPEGQCLVLESEMNVTSRGKPGDDALGGRDT